MLENKHNTKFGLKKLLSLNSYYDDEIENNS